MLIVSPVISSSSPSEKKKNELFPQCARTKEVAYPFSNIKTSQSIVDYEELKRLQRLSSDPIDKVETHDMFMKHYSSVIKPAPKRNWPSRNKSNGTTKMIEAPPSQQVENQSISTPLVTKSGGRNRKEITPMQRDIQTLRRLLRKIHIQRTNAENDEIFQIMSQFPEFMALDQRPEILREAIELAHLDLCEENQQPVLPSNGYFFILKGGVTSPLTTSELPPLSSHIPPEPLTVGQSFGSLKPAEGRSKATWLITTDENSEFLKINKDQFLTIKTKFEQAEYQEKCSLVCSCGEYKAWSKQIIDELLHLIEWIDYPQNTIIASEGFRCPFIGYLKIGECHVLRKVDVVKLEQNGTKSRQLRQVVMGKITAPDSFGEISVISQEAMTCTIVTSTYCWLGIIRPEKILELPDVTRKLMLQTTQRTFGHLTQDDIRREYVSQETRKEWTDFKNDIVHRVISKKKHRRAHNE
ncbi:unnamed protein product [Adineta steineri]|uniref:Cyclic nucleotide-binding domain-containing protein n=1 Tax=Adineta steineri TaxID=433720 RepID=A0A819BNM0_9BILA|nr:unnamed protein product [Adineta steineri]CAF3805047.1 unnamed protein product [Adineta steineri]